MSFMSSFLAGCFGTGSPWPKTNIQKIKQPNRKYGMTATWLDGKDSDK